MTSPGVPGTDVVLHAPVLEIFASLQGEGIFAGEPQVFIRFGGCNLACDYCDTPESIPAGSGERLGVAGVFRQVSDLDQNRAGSVVSLTGGEPLLHLPFLKRLVPALKHAGRRIYLETNGTLPRALEQIVEGCDRIAMDWKFESATGRDYREVHRWFLETGGSKVFVKMVLTAATQESEFRSALQALSAVSSAPPLVLQPATPWGTASSIPLSRLTSWWDLARTSLRDVRIIPQLHRLWDVR